MNDQLLGILYIEFFYGVISILLLSNMPYVPYWGFILFGYI